MDKFSKKLQELIRGPIHDLLANLDQERRHSTNEILTALIDLAEEEHKAAAEARLRDDSHAALVEEEPNVLWIADIEGNITYFNRAWYAFTGAAKLQSSGWGWLTFVDERDRERATAVWTEHLQKGLNFELELRLNGKAKSIPSTTPSHIPNKQESRENGQQGNVVAPSLNETSRWFSVRAVAGYNQDGEISRWSGSMIDIHDSRRMKDELSRRVRELQRINDIKERTQERLLQSEALFRTMCEASTHLIWTTNATGQSDYFNEPWCIYSGLSREEIQKEGINWLHIVHQDDRQQVEADWQDCIGYGREFECEARLKRWDGVYRWNLIRGLPLRGEGRISKWCCTATDIESHRRLVDELTKARDQAQMASQIKSEFVANMSHEIRTPMNGILGMIEILLRSELSPQAREYAQLVQEAGRSLLSILNDILDFSKIEAGRLDITDCEFDLVGLVEGVGEILSPQADAKGLLLSTFIDPRIPSLVSGDPLRLRQILLNLGGNAIKFTSQGSVTIKIEPTQPDGQDENLDQTSRLRFSVIDTGIGIPEDARENLFEPFVQVDGSISRRYGGTGLGLSISKRLIELLGGQIKVQSKVGLGSNFYFELPICVTLKSAGEAAASGDHILIVDQDKQLLECLSSYCLTFGIQTATVSNLTEALRALEHLDEQTGRGWIIVDAARNREWALDIFERALWGKKNYQLLLLTTKNLREQTQALIPDENVRVVTRPVRRSALKYYLNITETNLIQKTSPAPQEVETSPAKLPLRAMVADDNALNRQVAKLLLESLGIEVILAENGMEAVATFDSNNFDLIFLDCQMPELDGYSASRIIRRLQEQRGERIPIIAMTANALEGSRESCLEAGMDDYLPKPIEPLELERVIKAWTGSNIVHRREPAAQPAMGATMHKIVRAMNDNAFSLAEDRLKEEVTDETGPPSHPTITEVAMSQISFEKPREIDYETLLARFKTENTKQLLTMFKDTAQQELDGLHSSFLDGDYSGLRAKAHAFKGACATICAPQIASSLQKVEEASNRADTVMLEELMQQLRARINQALGEIEEHLVA